MKVDLLAIAAHPDDVELTSGGTLLKMAAAGYRTGILDLTRGETGTRGTPEIRLKEAARAAKIMRVAVRRNLGLPDAHLEMREDYKLAIAEAIRELQPRTVILPFWKGGTRTITRRRNWDLKRVLWRGSKIIRWGARRTGRSKYCMRRLTTISVRHFAWTLPRNSTGGSGRFWRTPRSLRRRRNSGGRRWCCRSTSWKRG